MKNKNSINPKSLKGNDKLDRIKDLMSKMTTINESTSRSELEFIKKGADNVIYGIIRENHTYFIKTTNKKSGELLSEDFNYIGGVQNKYSESYRSYAEALKHLNMKFEMINENYGIENGLNLFESDGTAFSGGLGFGFVVEEEEKIEEEEKFTLKVPAPKTSEKQEEPSMELPVEDEVSSDDMEMDTEEPESEVPSTEEGDVEGGDETKEIQKMTGKLGQMLRDMVDADPKLEKYVINSILSALHLDDFSEKDLDDIKNKLDGEVEEDEDSSDAGEEEMDVEEPASDASEEEIDVEEPASEEVKKESFVYKKGQLKESFRKKINESVCKECVGDGCENCDYTGLNEELFGGQKKLDVAEPHGKLTSADFNKLRTMKSEEYDLDTINSQLRRSGITPNDEELSNIRGAIDMNKNKKLSSIKSDEYDMNEMDGSGYGLDVADSISADFDDDADGISNRLDIDDDNDAILDNDDFSDLDIEFMRANAPTKEPSIKPTTTPTIDPGRERRIWKKPTTPGKEDEPRPLPAPKALRRNIRRGYDY